jgi:hypothetical protein
MIVDVEECNQVHKSPLVRKTLQKSTIVIGGVGHWMRSRATSGVEAGGPIVERKTKGTQKTAAREENECKERGLRRPPYLPPRSDLSPRFSSELAGWEVS